MSKRDKIREDANETAFRVLQETLGEREHTKPPEDRSDEEKNPEAVRRGKKGGGKGGDARARKLSEQEREEAAQLAALARWKKGG